MARLALFLGLLLASGWAYADPFSLIAAAVNVAFEFTGIKALGVMALGSLLGAADARRKASARAEEQRQQYNASLQDRNITALSNDAPWQVIYGSPAPVGGALVAMFSSGPKDENKHLVIAFAAHECQAIDEIYIEGDPVGALDSAGWATTGSMFFESSADTSDTELVTFTGTSGTLSRSALRIIQAVQTNSDGTETTYTVTNSGASLTLSGATNLTLYVTYAYNVGASRVNVQKHLSPGGVDTADTFLISQVPTKWTAAHKLSGYTYIVLTLDLNMPRFQGGPPNVTAKIRGRKIYDYRTSTTAYSTNPALCVADYLRSESGFSALSSQIDSTAAIAAANACDAQGYNCNGSFTTDAPRDGTLKALEDSMAGRTHWSGGVWRIIAGAWATPVMTLTDANLAAPIEVTQAANPRAARFNSVRGKFQAAAGLGVTSDFTPYTVASYVSADGSNQWLDTSYPFTATNAECQKLAAIEVERSRAGLTITYPAHLSAWALQPGDRVNLSNTELGFVSKTFRLQDWTHVNNAPLGLVLVEDVASMWTGTFTTADPLAVTSNLADPWAKPAAPASLTAQSGTNQLLKNRDGTIIARVLCTWPTSTVRAVLQGGYTQLQWRMATATDDQWINADLAPDASSMFLEGVKDGSNILIRARYLTGVGAQGYWTTITHTVVGKTAAPTTPTNPSISNGAVYWSKVSDLDLAGYMVRAVPGASASWGSGTALHDGVVTSIPFVLPTQLYGVQTVMVVSKDTTGNLSDVVSVTYDFSTPNTGNVIQSYDYRANTWPGSYTNCSVSGGDLVASVASSPDVYILSDLYSQSDLYAATYNAMQWVSQVFVPRYNGTITLNATTLGTGVTIEYQIDASASADPYSSSDVYASSDLYGASGAWTTWPGALAVKRMQGIIFRVSIAGGNTQGTVTAFTPYFSMPSVRQTFGSTAITAGGTRLAPSAGSPAYTSWVQINTVQATPIADGGGAISGQVLELNGLLGPVIQLVNSAGTSVNGSATLDIGGIVDV